MPDTDIDQLRAAIVALEGQRDLLGSAVVDLSLAPLRARLASLQRPAGLRHRQLTVLFADVVGSTAMAQGLDAEDALLLLSGSMRRMAAVVEAHQGRVLQFTGDGVKAVFGADEAREDDAERAVRAGLAILAAAREQADGARRSQGIADFAVRVGVHTGDVALGAGVEADHTAIGAAVHIAARMEQSAPPGALRISHDTWGQVRGLFDVESQPPLQVKGVEAPMSTYLVRAARARGFAGVERGVQGLHTPMVGRDLELQCLLDTVERARRSRQAQAVTLIGDAGLGKSRLLRECIAALNTDPAGHQLLAVRAQPDAMLRPWGLLRGLLAAQFGVADIDSADTARRKVVDGLAPWFAERGERHAQLIGQLAGLDFGASPHLRGLDPRSLRDQALAALRAYLRALGADGRALPVLVVEDLHWADDGSLDLLQDLVAHAADLPLAMIMTGRPALLTRRPDWAAPEALLTLAPLAAAQRSQLAQALLQRLDRVPPELTERIVGPAEGNPYYMEELLRRFIDEGVIDADGERWTLHAERLHKLRLPGTLVGLLQARLDSLPPTERHAARQASIIGHVFWDEALQALDADAPQALPALQRAAIVRDHEASGIDGTPERQFDHHLLHQVTYDTLLKAERKLGHGLAARWLQQRTRDRGAEFLALTAEHAERAGETALAIDCFEQAGKEAQKRFQTQAAVSCLQRAQDLLGDSDPERSHELLDRVTNIADFVGDRVLQQATIQARAAFLERHPNDKAEAELCLARALLADRHSDVAVSEHHARRAFELAERCADAMVATLAQGQLAMLERAREAPLNVIAHLQIGLGWAARIEPEHARAHAEAQLQTLLAMAWAQLCRFDEARQTLQSVRSRGEALGLPRLQLGALGTLAEVAIRQGRWAEVDDCATRMSALAEVSGVSRSAADASSCRAQIAESLDEHAQAMQHWLQALAVYRAIGHRRMEALNLLHLGLVQLAQGDAQAALQSLAQAQALHATLREAVEANEVEACVAWCEVRLGQPEAAMSTLAVVLGRLQGELAERQAHETITLRWHCLQVLQALGDARAAPWLEQLFADVQARAAELTDAADRERLIQALPVFRRIVAAHAARGTASTASAAG